MMSKIRTRCRIRKENPKLAVCITMYNEDEGELKRTLRGCLHNYNCLKIDPKTNFTKDDFLVVVICDGYERIPASFKAMAREKQLLDEEVLFQKGFMDVGREGEFKMKNMRDIMDPNVDPDKVPSNILHCFQATTWDFGIDDTDILKGRRINFMFCIKQRNDGKINSHKWFFQGICKYLRPEHCLMLDIGTRADDYALLKLYNHMKADANCGGCCGEIEVDLTDRNEYGCGCDGQDSASGNGFGSYLVQASQFFEYKMGHTPDKACESFFGFTQVLPGAYCIFRWEAIKGGPLDAFFKNVTRTQTPTCAEANEYLAEDRIMCLQIYIKIGCKYELAYVPDAKAYTDAPPDMMTLMKQRRRWMNGAFFGTKKVIANFVNMVSCKRTKHGCWSKFLMSILMFYSTSLYTLQFFIIGAMFAAVYAFFDQAFNAVFDGGNYRLEQAYQSGLFNLIFAYAYIFLLIMVLILALALPLERASTWFNIVIASFGFLTTVCIAGIIFYLEASTFYPPEKRYNSNIKEWEPTGESYFSVLVLAGVIMLSVYIVPMILRPIDFLSNFAGYTVGLIAYILLIPMYINVFSIYSFSNLHDVSWGNRPTTSGTGTEAFSAVRAVQIQTEANYSEFRGNVLFIWLCSNAAYFFIVLKLTGSSDPMYVSEFIDRPLSTQNNSHLIGIKTHFKGNSALVNTAEVRGDERFTVEKQTTLIQQRNRDPEKILITEGNLDF